MSYRLSNLLSLGSRNAFMVFSAILVVFSLGFVAAEDAAPAADSNKIIGIDLGTTFSCVGYFGDQGVQIFSNEQGSRITPSWVAIGKKGELLVGEAAKNQATTNPENTVFDAKRLIGRKFNDPEVQSDMKQWTFKVVNKNDNPYIPLLVDGKIKHFAPEEISALVLGKMKEIAEAGLGETITDAVVTVPAYFNDAQRQATKDAGTIAKLNVVRIINEPTAAAIAYGLDVPGERNILVFDLGGGTFDVSLLTFENGVFEVKAVSGDTHLGGQDFDNKIITWATEICKKKHGIDITKNNRLMSRFRREAEKAKILLSSAVEATIYVDSIGEDKEFNEVLTRAKFEEINKALFDKCIPPVERALKDAQWDISKVNNIVLVGGSTRIPKVQEKLSKFFNGKKLDNKVNPDEAVAYGAAIQAGVLMGSARTKDVLVIDAAALTLGIEVSGGVMEPLINRNTAIPTKKSKIFSTASDNQSVVSIKIYEGERSFAKDNHLLGSFDLSGIPLAPRGVPQIEVTFDLDANSILTVSAVDKGSSNNSKSIRITNDQNRLSKADVERMINDAEKFKEEDERRKKTVEALNKFETYLYGLKNQVTDEKQIGSRISEEDKKAILDAVAEGTKWVEEHKDSATEEDYTEQQSKIEKIAAPIMSKLYQAGGAAPEETEQGGSSGDHDEL